MVACRRALLLAKVAQTTSKKFFKKQNKFLTRKQYNIIFITFLAGKPDVDAGKKK